MIIPPLTAHDGRLHAHDGPACGRPPQRGLAAPSAPAAVPRRRPAKAASRIDGGFHE